MTTPARVSRLPDITETQVIDLRTRGSTGLNAWGGSICDETLPQLEGQRGARVFRDMTDNDDICGAIVSIMQQLIRTTNWRVADASSNWYDQEAAEFLYTCMHDMEYSWLDHVCEFMSMAPYGYSIHEMVYKQRLGRDSRKTHRSRYMDARTGWRYLPIRSQDSIMYWIMDGNGDLLGFQQQAPNSGEIVTIPMSDCVHFRTTAYKNNPLGKSIFRSSYEAWYYKRHMRRVEAIGVERDIAGMPCMGVPAAMLDPNAPIAVQAKKQAYMTMLKNVRNGEQSCVMYPLSYDEEGNLEYEFKLLSASGGKQFDVDKIQQRYDHRIALAAMADFMLLGASGSSAVGSNAMHADKTSTFVKNIKAFLDIITAELNRKAVPALMDQNVFRMSDYPMIEHSGIDNVDMKDLGDYLSKLASTGIQLFPNPELERAVLEAADLPVPTDIDTPDREPSSQPVMPTPPSEVQHIVPDEAQQQASLGGAVGSHTASHMDNTQNNRRVVAPDARRGLLSSGNGGTTNGSPFGR